METSIELIKITEHNGKKAVSARELHSFLGSKREFATWIKDRIKKYGLVENQDFVRFDDFVKTGGRSIEYALTLDCAKELAMVEGSAKGKQARQYFIECEKTLKEVAKPLSTLDLLELTVKGMRENNQELQEVKRDVLELKARTLTRPEYFTAAAYGTITGTPVNNAMASFIGRKATKICNQRGFPIDKVTDARWGFVNSYPKEVLEEVFNQPIN